MYCNKLYFRIPLARNKIVHKGLLDYASASFNRMAQSQFGRLDQVKTTNTMTTKLNNCYCLSISLWQSMKWFQHTLKITNEQPKYQCDLGIK